MLSQFEDICRVDSEAADAAGSAARARFQAQHGDREKTIEALEWAAEQAERAARSARACLQKMKAGVA
jgi:hypothetical protein